ncbi:hypothetical protein HMPREF1482_00705 [Bifidobacterium breve HPH0326]|nr:hypothetical protein HMPREF1482_00705 [Bifidobacterium breve HPH0326]
MTGAQASHCGSVSAISLGLPVSTAIPEAKGILPKALFVGKAPISGKLKQRFVNEIESITMLALARSANTGLADGKLIPEVLIIGLKLTAKATEIPSEVIELIAGQRKSGIVFACVREVPFEGRTREECARSRCVVHSRGVPDTRLFITCMQATGSRQGSASLS